MKRFFSKTIVLFLATMLTLSLCGGCFFIQSEDKWCEEVISTYFLGYSSLTKEQQKELIKSKNFNKVAGDKYSRYLTAQETDAFMNENSGHLYGAGVSFDFEEGDASTTRDDKYLVNNVSNPDYYGDDKIKRFDCLYGAVVDGVETIYYDQNGFLKEEYSSAREVLSCISTVDDGEKYSFIFNRMSQGNFDSWDNSWYNLVYVECTMEAYDDAEYVRYYSLDSDTAYIELNEFEYGADTQFDKAMKLFRDQKKKNLVLDLRFNPGGDLQILSNISSHLIKGKSGGETLIMEGIYETKEKEYFYSSASYYDANGIENIVVLAGGGTASASEVLIGAMKDYNTLTKQIGETTYGKGIMQQVFFYNEWMVAMTGNTKTPSLYMTVAKLYMPISKISWHGEGFAPDIAMQPTYFSSQTNDPQLSQAKSFLNSLNTEILNAEQ